MINQPFDEMNVEAQVIANLRSLNIEAIDVERYGMHPDQFIEWYGPEEGAVVVIIHGGYFHEDGTLSYLRPAALALAEMGYRVALPEYRRGAGQQEATFEDAFTLARHPHLADATWVSHSGGSILALKVLLSDETSVQHLVALSPVFDLAAAAEDWRGEDAGPIATWLGGMPYDIPDKYARCEPLGDYFVMGPEGFQQRGLRLDIIHGALDQTVPIAGTRALNNEVFNIAIVSNENHNDPIRPGSDAWLLLLGSIA